MTPDQRRHAIIEQLRRVRRERKVAFEPREASEPVPGCSDCRFGPLDRRNICEHFAHWNISPDKRLKINVTTTQARSDDGLCGPDAMLFEPYRGWRKLARIASKVDLMNVFVGLSVVGGILFGILR
jgi:hypothetical protein